MTLPKIVFDILLSMIVVMGVGALTAALALALWRALRVRADREHTLRLENLGNTRSVFRLLAESAEPGLDFRFYYNNVPLVEVYEEIAEPAPGTVEQPAPAHAGSAPARKPGAAAAQSGPNVAVKTGRAVAGKAGIMGSLLGSLGGLIPGAAGRQLKAQAQTARSVQQGTTRAMQAPQDAKRQADSLKSDSARLAGKSPERAPSRPGAPARVVGQPAGTASTGQGVAESRLGRLLYVQTPEIHPGQSLSLTVRIGTHLARYPRGSFNYTLLAEQVAPDFPEVMAGSIRKTGVVYFAPIGLWRYWLPAFASALMTLTGLAAIAYAFMLIWQ